MLLVCGIGDALHARGFDGDFRAFRCGAAALLRGESPYAQAAIYPCESTDEASFVYRARDGVALPAPLPGYALAAIVPFALVPLGIAACAWSALLLLAFAFAVRCLGAVGVPAAATLAVAGASVALVSLAFGELVPLSLAACCGCALALRRSHPAAAAGWAAMAAIEPHIGGPLLLALAVRRSTRWFAAGFIALLALVHLAVLRSQSLAYFTEVLPAHARAEMMRSSQYSLTWIVAALGASPTAALAAGFASYACAAVAGIVVARMLARRSGDDVFYAFVPPAFALAGGSFVHLAQMLVALPLALALARNAARGVRRAAAASVVLLAIPWQTFAQTPWFLICALPLGCAIGAWALGWNAPRAIALGLGATLLAAGIAWLGAHRVPGALPAPALDPHLAEAAWAQWIAGRDASSAPAVWLAKLPTWIGLLLLVGASVSARVFVERFEIEPVA